MVVLLRPLRDVFENSGPGIRQREFFDEYLDANELELALHILCEYILESPAFAGRLHRENSIKDIWQSVNRSSGRIVVESSVAEW
jgi:hypothetical protein